MNIKRKFCYYERKEITLASKNCTAFVHNENTFESTHSVSSLIENKEKAFAAQV